MNITDISYECGNPHGLYVGRVSLHLHDDERFEARYEHRAKCSAWRGTLLPGTFGRACKALSSAGFPNVPPLGELAPGDAPIELAWRVEGMWQRGELLTSETTFYAIRSLASTIISALDANVARMPPGEASPIVDAQPA